MMPDPKLVDALVGGLGDGDCGPLEARFVQSLHQGMGLEYEDAERWADIFMRSVRGVLTRRIEQHRLVQLPEEPSGWQAEMPEGHPNWPGWIRPVSKKNATWEAQLFGSNRIRPVYIIPGDPQDVEP